MVRLTDCLNLTIVVDWDVKQQNKQTKTSSLLCPKTCKVGGQNVLYECKFKNIPCGVLSFIF